MSSTLGDQDPPVLHQLETHSSSIEGWPLTRAIEIYQQRSGLTRPSDCAMINYLAILDSRSRVHKPTLSSYCEELSPDDVADPHVSLKEATPPATSKLSFRRFAPTRIPTPVHTVKAPKRKAQFYKLLRMEFAERNQESVFYSVVTSSSSSTDQEAADMASSVSIHSSVLSHSSSDTDTLDEVWSDCIPSMIFETKVTRAIHYQRGVEIENEFVRPGWCSRSSLCSSMASDRSQRTTPSETVPSSMNSNKSRARLKYEQMLQDYFENHYQGPKHYSLKHGREDGPLISVVRLPSAEVDSDTVAMNYYSF